ncbi:MAG: hypothetical protein WDO13_05630 [Verrucomicrobiota bacterium]
MRSSSHARLAARLWPVRRRSTPCVIQALLFLCWPTLTLADTGSDSTVPADTKGISTTVPPRLQIQGDATLDGSYVGTAHLRDGASGNLGEETTQFAGRVKVPINDPLSLNFGLDYRRFDFGQPDNSPLPYNLQVLSVNVGASRCTAGQRLAPSPT